ncbi:MAG: hypothetical protein SFX73_30255 [Kofleriaceae bacterium]|nr:hypothetical protein [Kofleriaceae bacterium]
MRAKLVLVASAGLFTACLEAAPEEGSTFGNVETQNRLGVNRLGVNRLGVNRLAAGHLAASRISNDTLVLDNDAAQLLLATEDGRDVLTYIIGCAVPEGTVLTVENPSPGAPSEYFGSLGLAESWLDRPLNKKGERWVSACLFARVNANEEAVPISLRGSHPELATTQDEVATYSVQEGAFWGNYFVPLDEEIQWYSCRGRGQAAGESGGLADRDCAEASATDPDVSVCGFRFTGDCFGRRGACDKEKRGNFSDCEVDDDFDDDRGDGHGKGKGGHGDGKDRGHSRKDDIDEVITTYVTPE